MLLRLPSFRVSYWVTHQQLDRDLCYNNCLDVINPFIRFMLPKDLMQIVIY
jgi:hypothetical protein